MRQISEQIILKIIYVDSAKISDSDIFSNFLYINKNDIQKHLNIKLISTISNHKSNSNN